MDNHTLAKMGGTAGAKTMLDEFALAALAGVLANPDYKHRDYDETAANAYAYAEAMLDERKRIIAARSPSRQPATAAG